MLVIWGQRLYGRIDRYGGSHIATRFFHIYYVPLIPLSSWLVLEEQADGRFLSLQIPMQLRSVLLAWLRVISVVLLVVGGFNVLGRLGGASPGIDGAGVTWAAISGLSVVGTFYGFFLLGKLTRAQMAQRAVYFDLTGKFVDVALLGDGRAPIKQQAIEEVDRHLVKHALGGYREAPQAAWREIATRPDQRDAALLRPALTRCRLEWAEARGEARRALDRDHALIFKNLLAAQPELLEQSTQLTI